MKKGNIPYDAKRRWYLISTCEQLRERREDNIRESKKGENEALSTMSVVFYIRFIPLEFLA